MLLRTSLRARSPASRRSRGCGASRLRCSLAALAPLALRRRHRRRRATIEPAEDGWKLDAEFDVQFSPRLEEAVNRGVPLYFVVEFELSRPRWYWFDEKPVQLSQTYKISYTPLLRQYRLRSATSTRTSPDSRR